MDFREYQENAKRTMADLGSLELNLSHMVLGIISEDEELLEALVKEDEVNAREECIDKIWYIANYCTLRGLDLEEIVGNPYQLSFELQDWEHSCSTHDVYSSRLADYVKKFIAYGKPIEPELERMAIEAIVVSLSYDDIEIDYPRDLENNINKLKIRYPEKFDTAQALNRNIEEERKVLES